MLCEFTLPSNPAVNVRLREATVSDAIDFSSIDPNCEEEATSLFLERIQEKETYTDPRQWTGEDRRYAMFTYFVHTSTYKTIPLTYTCSICGHQHTSDIELAKIMNEYTPIVDASFREFPHNGHNVIVRPLNGRDLENIEKYRMDMELTEDELQSENLTEARRRQLNAEIRSKRVRLAMYRAICCIDMPYLDESGTRESRQIKVEEVLKVMPASEFRELFTKVEKALTELRHGLRTAYVDGRLVLEIPDVKCLEQPGVPGVTLRYPFRFVEVIPTI